MIFLDTNVVSELTNKRRDPRVTRWLDRQSPDDLWTTAINVYELRFGVELLSLGSRRTQMEQDLDDLLDAFFELKIASVDPEAADQAARLSAQRRKVGRIIDFRDTLIAGVALVRQAKIATRNVRHFADLPVQVIDPWTA